MSGPKVVRIVTKEELIGRCERAFARFESSCAEMRRIAKRADLLSAELEESLERRRRELRKEIDGGRVQGLEARILSAEQFVRAESGRVQAEAQLKLERERERERVLGATARTLANALIGTNSGLASTLLAAASDQSGSKISRCAVLEAMVRESYEVLSRDLKLGTPIVDNDLAKRLSQGIAGDTYADWIKANVRLPEEDARLSKLMVQIELLGAANIMVFRRRADEIAAESDPDRRAVLTDSIVMELADAVRMEQLRVELVGKADALRMGLSRVATPLGSSAAAQLEAAMERDDLGTLEAAVTLAEEVVAGADQKAAADSRRAAVLGGLAKLGYRVDEGMATAWSQNGRIVVAKPQVLDYGIELGATPDGQTMQVRLVGSASPSSPRNRERDTKMEGTWCSEFSELQKLVALSGSDLQIKKAIGVGVEPVRSVDTRDIERARLADASRTSKGARILK